MVPLRASTDQPAGERCEKSSGASQASPLAQTVLGSSINPAPENFLRLNSTPAKLVNRSLARACEECSTGFTSSIWGAAAAALPRLLIIGHAHPRPAGSDAWLCVRTTTRHWGWIATLTPRPSRPPTGRWLASFTRWVAHHTRPDPTMLGRRGQSRARIGPMHAPLGPWCLRAPRCATVDRRSAFSIA